MLRQSAAWPTEFYGVVVDDSPRFRFLDKSPPDQTVREALSRHLRPRARVLDIGCGAGIGACHLAAAGVEGVAYVGIDRDARASERASRVLAALPPARVAGRVIPQPLADFLESSPDPVDLILWSHALHECVDLRDPASHSSMARRVAALLVRDGVLIVGDAFIAPGASEDERARIYRYHKWIGGAGDSGKPFLDPPTIEALFGRAGVTLVERANVPGFALARYLGLPHAQYALRVFRKGEVQE